MMHTTSNYVTYIMLHKRNFHSLVCWRYCALLYTQTFPW